MSKTKSENPKSSSNTEFKTSLANLSLNSIIFLLAALIIYMGYSLFVKLKFDNTDDPIVQSSGKASEIIQVEILNGCGVSGVADRFRDYLRKEGFDVVNVDNYIQFDVEETMVIDRIGNIANAKKVAKSLKTKTDAVFPQLNDDYFVDVTIVIGRDYHKLTPLK